MASVVDRVRLYLDSGGVRSELRGWTDSLLAQLSATPLGVEVALFGVIRPGEMGSFAGAYRWSKPVIA